MAPLSPDNLLPCSTSSHVLFHLHHITLFPLLLSPAKLTLCPCFSPSLSKLVAADMPSVLPFIFGLCFCSCLFPPLLLIAKLLASCPPIKAWASPLPIPLRICPVSTLGHLLPTLVLGPFGRWVWKDGKDAVCRSWVSIIKMRANEHTYIF